MEQWGVVCKYCTTARFQCEDCNKDPVDGPTMFTSRKGLYEIQPSQDTSPFEAIGNEVGKLVTEKNEAYGDSFAKAGQFLSILYPNGIQPNQYMDMLGLVRIFDKQMRIANRKDAFGESPWRDITGYGILGVVNDEKEKQPV